MGRKSAKPPRPQFVLDHFFPHSVDAEMSFFVRSAGDVAAVFGEMASLTREIMVSGALDSKCRLIHTSLIAVGTTEHVFLRPGDIFRGAVGTAAVAVFLVHNHPSGSLAPSGHDFRLTLEVAEAGLVLGYPLADHVIVAREGYRSLMNAAALKDWGGHAVVTNGVLCAAEGVNSVAWSCGKCGRTNTAVPMPVLAGSNCLPARCEHCRTFTWLNCSSSGGAKERERRR